MKEMYYGTTWKWPIEHLPRVMLSANVVANMKSIWQMPDKWMMDSGIGGLFANGKRPVSIEKYMEIIEKWNPPIAWSYDWPCEPSIRENTKMTVRQSQEKTTENTIYLREKFDTVYSVIQGWRLEEYLEHIDQLKEQDLITERMGIGSICRRGQNREIARIVRAIHNNVPSWVKLHGFGIKVSVLKDTDARFYLHSVDSQSWGYEMRYGDWLRGQYNGKTWKDKVPNLKSYVSRIESMLNPLEPLYAEALK